jgi:UDP-2,4-diacetamido-2,4,6-trideoxy-beta-L-altropyranose hydrolase
MRVVIRTDASAKIGSGHLMRCLTLARGLRQNGSESIFVSREHEGHLNDLIIRDGFDLIRLPAPLRKRSGSENVERGEQSYADWLGVSQEEDARETISVIAQRKPNWLIVDHYGLDEIWEKLLRPYVEHIMVIDDLANRSHDCQVLLDQNWFENQDRRYDGLTPVTCEKLLGPTYALLRPEFHEARKELEPHKSKIERVFIFFGASDPSNLTGLTLDVLSEPEFVHLEVDVVIGQNNQHRAQIGRKIRSRSAARLYVQIADIAKIMAKADFALGAGGATTWERFCLGLPSVVVTTAENQVNVNTGLSRGGFIYLLGNNREVTREKLKAYLLELVNKESHFYDLNFSEICDGLGVPRTIEMLNRFALGNNQEVLSKVYA